jgi:hypothetical protein
MIDKRTDADFERLAREAGCASLVCSLTTTEGTKYVTGIAATDYWCVTEACPGDRDRKRPARRWMVTHNSSGLNVGRAGIKRDALRLLCLLAPIPASTKEEALQNAGLIREAVEAVYGWPVDS